MTDVSMEDRMRKGWKNGLPETPCGLGSTKEFTEALRHHLFDIHVLYDLDSINDIGAGDLNWILDVPFIGVGFRAFDIYPRHPDVKKLDITKERPPDCDLTICRDVMVHLTNEEALAAIKNIRASSKYMMLTTYDISENGDLNGRVWRPLNLRLPPFDLHEPIYQIEEKTAGKWCCLWE